MKVYSIKKGIRSIGLLTLFVIVSSCEDFVTIPAPTAQLMQEAVFEDDATAIAAISSVYIKLANGQSFDGSSTSLPVFQGLYADELLSYSPVTSSAPRVEFYFNNVSPLNGIVSLTW